MYKKNVDLVVGRDRAHVRSLLADYPRAEVVSASHFFDKIMFLCFLHEHVQRDDAAPLIFAHHILENHKTYSIRLARSFSSLYAALYHGVSVPQEVLLRIKEEDCSFISAIEVLCRIDEAMHKAQLVTKVTALFRALHIMNKQNLLPPALAYIKTISLHHLIDLTSLEIEIIKALSRLGYVIDVHFPLDFEKRGINVAVDYAARQFESDEALFNIELLFENIAQPGPLLPLVTHLFKEQEYIQINDEHCTIISARDLIEEAEILAQRVAQTMHRAPKESCAVVIRSIDARSAIFKRALLNQGLMVKDRKGTALDDTAAGKLLDTIFKAKLLGLPKSALIGLWFHPLYIRYLNDEKERALVLSLLDKLGVDDRIVQFDQPSQRYLGHLERFQNFLPVDDPFHATIAAFKDGLAFIDDVLSSLQGTNSLHAHLISLQQVIKLFFQKEDPAALALIKFLEQFLLSPAFASLQQSSLSLRDFYTLIKTELTTITIPQPDNPYVYAIELLLLPELLGRYFDHVFIVDISFGRMPKNPQPDPIIGDHERLKLNAWMKKPVLRVFLEDPFEPMPTPPRQTLEALWFAMAVASAQKSIFFSCSQRDENSQEQSASEFFLWLQEHVTIEESIQTKEYNFFNAQRLRFFAGIERRFAKNHDECVYEQALITRQDAFEKKHAASYSFLFDVDSIHKAFSGRISEPPQQALTPTIIEAFADCRFKGMLNTLFSIKSKRLDEDDVDARVLGQIAHETLERFFKEKKNVQSLNLNDDVANLLEIVVSNFSAKNYVKNISVLNCHKEWLLTSLIKLIKNLYKMQKEMGSSLLASEIAIGTSLSSLKALALSCGTNNYLIGGRVDRIERSGTNFLIIDYKLSLSDVLKAKVSARQLLSVNFQVPLYLRLVAHHFAKNDKKNVSFSFASIKDGLITQPVSYESHKDIFAHIFATEKEDNVAVAIDAIFAPIKKGIVLPTVLDHCARCDFTYVCRRTEWEKYA